MIPYSMIIYTPEDRLQMDREASFNYHKLPASKAGSLSGSFKFTLRDAKRNLRGIVKLTKDKEVKYTRPYQVMYSGVYEQLVYKIKKDFPDAILESVLVIGTGMAVNLKKIY